LSTVTKTSIKISEKNKILLDQLKPQWADLDGKIPSYNDITDLLLIIYSLHSHDLIGIKQDVTKYRKLQSIAEAEALVKLEYYTTKEVQDRIKRGNSYIK